MMNRFKRTITKTKSKSKCPICRERLISVNAQYRYCPICTPINSDLELSENMIKDQRRREKENNVIVWNAKKCTQEFLQNLVDECRKR
jgi:excinuclease UvrABC ATPase subunit